MDTNRIPLLCAVGALTAWTLKGVAIGLAGGLDRSAYESPLLLVGLAFAVACAVGLAVVLTRGRHRLLRVVAGLLVVPALFAAAITVDGVVRAVSASQHWTLGEVNLWVLAVVLLAVSARVAQPGVGATSASAAIRPAHSRARSSSPGASGPSGEVT